MKVAIIGSRTLTDPQVLKEALSQATFSISEVCCGEASGADTLGRLWAEKEGIPVSSFPAEWDDITAEGAVVKTRLGREYNSQAGKDRNIKMIAYADAVIALWDGKSPGTKHALRVATEMKKPIFIQRY